MNGPEAHEIYWRFGFGNEQNIEKIIRTSCRSILSVRLVCMVGLQLSDMAVRVRKSHRFRRKLEEFQVKTIYITGAMDAELKIRNDPKCDRAGLDQSVELQASHIKCLRRTRGFVLEVCTTPWDVRPISANPMNKKFEARQLVRDLLKRTRCSVLSKSPFVPLH